MCALFGLSQDVLDRWIKRGVPSTRLHDVRGVAAVAGRYRRMFKPGRIAEIVRVKNITLRAIPLTVLSQPGGAARVMYALEALASYVPPVP
ncbi:MAG: hypothetical protein JWP44_4854 [Mucilaginibacter sp.]|nr:hypothetical protein [Mucilaginibacter sp.]